ncbi:hypothetical protein [Streptomyces fuscichromogenes]|uniref:hypothetical protein n=1 Tax=Streptomyces fuscichromogenes TaxID=1324013 RepID=UPI0016702217|nr:hypothetical protein [Streptomyces fuscichromogenes]
MPITTRSRLWDSENSPGTEADAGRLCGPRQHGQGTRVKRSRSGVTPVTRDRTARSATWAKAYAARSEPCTKDAVRRLSR